MSSRWSGVWVLVSFVLVACGPERRPDDVDPADAGELADAGGDVDAGQHADAGDADAGEVEGCGAVTASGECRGNDAVWCEADELVALPCDDALDTGIDGTCTVAGSFGSWCAVGQGSQCAFERPGSQSMMLFVCGSSSSSGLACDLDDGCVPGGGACVPPASGQSFATSCMGSRLVIGCTPWGQKVTEDCVGDVGATGCSAGVCTGVAEGFACDDLRQCATGLTCVGGDCQRQVATASLAVSVTGGGKVVGAPGGLNCPVSCSTTAPTGTVVTLTAQPREGWAFEAWGGACAGTEVTTTVELSGAKSCTATFVRTHYFLTVDVEEGGRVTSAPAGVDCPGTCAHGFEPGTAVTLTAHVADGYRLARWEGCSSATTEAITVTVSADVTCTPVFDTAYEVEVTVIGPGRVKTEDGRLDCAGVCSAYYPYYEVVRFEAEPAPESRLVSWAGDCNGYGEANATLRVLSVDINTCQATFEVTPRHDLTVSVAGDGEVASAAGEIACPGDCTEALLEGAALTLTATPAGGSRFVQWRELSASTGSGCSGTSPTTTVAMTDARDCRAEFVKDVTASLAWRHAAPGQYSSYVAWRPDGGAVAFFGGSSVQLFDATTGVLLGSFSEANPHAVVLSPDGVTVAAAVSSGSNERVALRDVNAGTARYLPATGYVTTGDISSLAWSPDGQWLATADTLGAVKIWNAATGSPVMNWNPSTSGHSVSGLAWSPDGRHLATTFNTSGEGMSLWSTADWSLAKAFPAPSPSRVAWSPDSAFLVGAMYSEIVVWSVEGDTSSFETNSCLNASFDPTGTKILARCQGQATVWGVSSGEQIFTASLPHGASVFDASWSPTTSSIAIGGYDGSAWLVDADTHEVARSFGGPWGSVTELVLHPSREEVFGVSHDGLVYAVDARTGAHTRNLVSTKFDSWVRPNSLALSPDGDVLAVASGSSIHTWNTADATQHAPAWSAGSTVGHLRWSLSNVLATSLYSADGIALWPGGTMPSSATLSRSNHTFPTLSWHPGGVVLASAAGRETQLWDRTTNLPTVALPCPELSYQGFAEATAFSGEGTLLATICDNVLMAWRWSDGVEVLRAPVRIGKRLAWRQDDRVIAVVEDGGVQLYETEAGNSLLVSPLNTEGSATDVIWSADGGMLYVGTSSGRIEAYEIDP